MFYLTLLDFVPKLFTVMGVMYVGFLILKDSKSAYLSFHNEYDPDQYSHTYEDDYMRHV